MGMFPQCGEHLDDWSVQSKNWPWMLGHLVDPLSLWTPDNCQGSLPFTTITSQLSSYNQLFQNQKPEYVSKVQSKSRCKSVARLEHFYSAWELVNKSGSRYKAVTAAKCGSTKYWTRGVNTCAIPMNVFFVCLFYLCITIKNQTVKSQINPFQVQVVTLKCWKVQWHFMGAKWHVYHKVQQFLLIQLSNRQKAYIILYKTKMDFF